MQHYKLNIHARRKGLHLSQQELAEEVQRLAEEQGIKIAGSGATVHRDEKGSGKITLERLRFYAQFFGCAIPQLFDSEWILIEKERELVIRFRGLDSEAQQMILIGVKRIPPEAAE